MKHRLKLTEADGRWSVSGAFELENVRHPIIVAMERPWARRA